MTRDVWRRFSRIVVYAVGVVLAVDVCSVAVASEVPSPFTPIKTTPASANDGAEPLVEISVWGRIYRFERGPLPKQIVSQGIDLLAAPPRWDISVGSSQGSPSWSTTRVARASDRLVILTSSAVLGSIAVHASTRIEYDGMILVDLEIRGSGEDPNFELQRVRYELPFGPQVARWYNHHVSYDYRHLTIDKQQLISSVGPFPSRSRTFAYTPTFFVGNYDVGLEWWSDENLNWRTSGDREPILLRRDENASTLSVTPVAVAFRSDRPWRHRFALFPVPTRPAGVRWRSTRFVTESALPGFRHDGFRYFWIAFPGQILPYFHGLPEMPQTADQVALRRRLAGKGLGYIPYGKLMAAPSYHPVTLAHRDQWPANVRLFTGPTSGEEQLMKRNTRWRKGEPYGYNVCAARTDYFDWMLRENLKTLEEEDLDGLYFDFGSISSPCETDPGVESAGEQQAWHYFELRAFYKNLYEQAKGLKNDAIITIHTNGQPRALTTWVDYNFVGEAVNAVFRGGHTWAEVKRRPDLYDADYFQLPSLFMIAQTLPRVGGVTSILPQLHKASLDVETAELIRLQRGFLSQVLVNDIHFWFANCHHPSLVEIVAAIDRFGSLDDAELDPWWSQADWISNDSHSKVSVYSRDTSALVVVANWSSQDDDVELRLSARSGGRPKFVKWSDAEQSGKPPVELLDGAIRIRVPARNFRLLLLE